MNLKKLGKLTAILTVAAFSIVSCEDDYSEVGASIVDNNNFNALKFDETALSASSEKLTRVQTNNLPSYAFGIYNDPVYGKSEANIQTQLRLLQLDPDFGTNPIVDSVVLSIPYYSTITERTAESTTYKLDSVYGSTPIRFSLYESNYFLRSLDPNDEYNPQAYYSDQGDVFEQHLGLEPLYTSENFYPSSGEIRYNEVSNDTTSKLKKVSPRLRVKLPNDFFQNKIINQQGTSNLVSNSNFQDYLRGLYFKAEATQGNLGVYNLFDFAAHSKKGFSADEDANITIYYHADLQDVSVNKVYYLAFGSNTVNVFKSEFDEVPDDTNLYLKGGQGSMAEIDLFTDQQQLDSIREQGWLINEANLIFRVNKQDVPEGKNDPYTLFIYDLKNNSIVKDYSISQKLYSSTTAHTQPLEYEDNDDRYYKIRLTSYVNDIISADSTNTKLGVVISLNPAVTSLSKAEALDDEIITTVPTPEVLSPQGTVIYGPETLNTTKRLKLNIYYTKPE